MKKVIIIVASVILAAVIGISVPFIVNSGDKLVSSSVRELESNTYVIEIDTEKHSLDTKCVFSADKRCLGENNYLYRFIFNQQMLETPEPAYSIDYLDVSFALNYGDEVVNAYAACDKAKGYESINVNSDNALSFSGDTGYMEMEFILCDADPEDKIRLAISCAMEGNGFNSFNRIHGIEHEIML